VSGHALERNGEQRAIFMNLMADLVEDPNMLMFSDEASKDERTSARRHGWLVQGSRWFSGNASIRKSARRWYDQIGSINGSRTDG